jgi:hypothetical protein
MNLVGGFASLQSERQGQGPAIVWCVLRLYKGWRKWEMVVMPRQLRIDYPGAIHHGDARVIRENCGSWRG